MIKYTQEFELLWQLYPKRGGGNSKAKAFKGYTARIKAGYSRSDIGEGLQRYKNFCTKTNKIGTEFIMMAATFFGRDEHFLEEWDLPVEAKAETIEDKAKRLGLPAKVGETMEAWKRRVAQTR